MTSQRARKRASNSEYKTAREQRYVQARGRCEMCAKGLGDVWQTHHVQRRSNFVNHAVDNLRVLHPRCHEHIHANVEWAKNQGWIVAKWPQL